MLELRRLMEQGNQSFAMEGGPSRFMRQAVLFFRCHAYAVSALSYRTRCAMDRVGKPFHIAGDKGLRNLSAKGTLRTTSRRTAAAVDS